MHKMRTLFLSFLLVAAVAVSAATAQDLVLIANSDVPVDSISASDVEKIFLGKQTSWSNGSKIHFLTLKEPTTHETFLKSYVGKSPSQFKTFWKKQVFTGKGKMPKTAGSGQEMIDLVTKTSGAIGYVAAGTDLGGAKTLSVQ